MEALRLAVIGMLVVALDLNVGTLDLLFDPAGYLLVVLATVRLAPVHGGFGRARWGAVLGLLASIPAAILRRPEVTTSTEPVMGMTTTSPTGQVVEAWVPQTVETVGQLVCVVGICTALMALSREPRTVRDAQRLRVLLPVAELLGMILILPMAVAEGQQVPARWGALAGAGALLGVLVVVATLVLSIWFAVTLWRASYEPVEVPPQAAPAAMMGG